MGIHDHQVALNARLNESRVTAALIKRAGKHEFTLQGVWRSGVAKADAIDGRAVRTRVRARLQDEGTLRGFLQVNGHDFPGNPDNSQIRNLRLLIFWG